MNNKQPFVYIMASEFNGTIYTGVTSDLMRRVWEHKQDIYGGFTSKYNVKMLVWFESCDDMLMAIQREKQLKKWNRAWKIELIQTMNPTWQDLYTQLL